MNIDNERKAFEEWIKNEDPFIGNDDNQDCIWAKKYMWKAWLASANREGYKLLPVDSLKEIISCAYCHIYDRCVDDEGDDVINHILAMGVEDDH